MSNSNLEMNKVFAAILVAGIIAMLSGFIAEITTEKESPQKDAVTIEGVADDSGGSAAVVEMPQPILAMIATAKVSDGEALGKACAACHNFGKGDAPKVGPTLWGVVGRKRASMPGFAYSDAMVAMGKSWTYEDLNRFLWSPKKFVPGTKMGFAGFKKAEDRAAVIAWLRTLGDAPLPSAGEIAQEQKDLAPPEAAGKPADKGAVAGNKAAEGKAAAPAKEPVKK